MSNYKRNWPLIIILSIILYTTVSCGGQIDYTSPDTPSEAFANTEYQAWKNSFPTDPVEAVKWWNEIESKNGWKFVWSTEARSTFEAWQRKEFNCMVSAFMWLEIYPLCDTHRIIQPEFNHVVILYERNIISFIGLKGEVFDGWENYPYYQKIEKGEE